MNLLTRREDSTGTTTWYRHSRVGRFQFGIVIYRHRSHLPDRWVIHPKFTYDRKR